MLNKVFIKEVGLFNYVYRTAVRQFYKRVLKRDHEMLLPSGESIILPIKNKFASEAFITNGDVDWGSDYLFYSLLQGKGVFLDVGAHIGYYSIYVLPRVTAVYSFEPDPRVRLFLEKNTFDRPKIEIIPQAVSKSSGNMSFTLEDDAEVSHLSLPSDIDNKKINVAVTSVDDFVACRNLVVEAIKIDVEGFDTDVIEGSIGVLSSQKPIILTEAKLDQRLWDLMNRVDYSIFAYTREKESRSKEFTKFSQNEIPRNETKMLFLVHKEMIERIQKLA